MSLSLHRLKNFKAVKFRQRLICLYDWLAWFANGFKLQFPGFILSLFKVLKIREFRKKRLLLSTLVAPFVTNDRPVQHGFVYLVALVQFSPVKKFCRRCTWRFSCFSQYLSSRDKPSIFLKGVFEDRKCFEINNFFAGVDPDRPYKFQWLNFGLKFCAVCNVIAPRGSEELLQAFKTPAVNEVCSDDLTTLITAYKQAPSKNLKTQILSIYAPRYSARFLK